MDVLQQGIIALIRSSLTGEKMSLPEDFDLEEAYPQIVRHSILTMAYDGAVRCGMDKKLPVMRKLFQGYVKAMLHSEGQMKMLEKLCGAFDAEGVDYLLLKGAVLKGLYPKPELRQMGDADILIRKEQYGRIEPIMVDLGFTAKVESDHEYVWSSPELLLELHKRLIPSYNKDYYRYFGEGWQLAKACGDGRYAMSPEDGYIYLFTHFAKHYRDGGIGCRHVADLWVWKKTHPRMNEAYITSELGKLRLLEFERNIMDVLQFWLEGAEPNEKTCFISDFIFSSGSWGAKETRDISAGARSASEAGSIQRGMLLRMRRMVFPSAVGMQNRYPVLKRHPALTPVFWPVRWVSAVLFRRDNIRRQRQELADVTAERIESYRQALRYVGLDFHFEE